jgi:RND family efflux transporter MFP subunit
MKNFIAKHGRTLALAAVLTVLVGLLGFVALRAGPLAPVPVTLVTVDSQSIKPALFGIGTVEARFTHKIGPTFAGRIGHVAVQPGERVTKGQLLGEMDPVDLDDKISAQEATLKRAEANLLAVAAQVQDVGARQAFAELQLRRYEQLLVSHAVSEEGVQTKRQELQIAQASATAARANVDASRQELVRARAERDGFLRQRVNLRLVSPVDGIVTRRDADAGTTAVAGQAVIEVVEPTSIWVSVRFDQQRAQGLSAQLPAQIVLRSVAGDGIAGRVVRVEPVADAVTEEILAKVGFNETLDRLPPIGALAEVTVSLGQQPSMPVVPNASVQRVDGILGVWVVQDGSLHFVPVKTGVADLQGHIQILDGLQGGEQVVAYSYKTLSVNSRIKVVERVMGKAP